MTECIRGDHMVWDTTQSTLYTLSGAVERHNADLEGSRDGENTDRAYEDFRELPDNVAETVGSPAANDETEPLSEPCGQSRAERPSPHGPSPEPIRAKTERITPCEKCAEAPKEAECAPPPCANCPRLCPKCGKPLPERKPSMLEALLSDKDTLLLTALILLLWHEKADMKLIGALAFIMLSN